MNKAAIVARVAERMRLNKFTAEGAVDTVLEAIAESLAKEEDVRIAGSSRARPAVRRRIRMQAGAAARFPRRRSRRFPDR